MTDDKNLHAVASGTQARDSLVLIDMAEIQFLLSGDIVSLAPIDLMQLTADQMQPAADELACGYLMFEDELVPVFSLNRNLQLQTVADSRCIALAILSAGSQRFGLACLNVEKQSDGMPVFYPVPVCMSSRKQPFSEFAVINQRAVGLTSAAELLRVLRLRGVNLLGRQTVKRQGAF